jgi:rod shape-determining protein MreD
MKRMILPFLAGVLLLTAQATVLLALPIHRIRPDLMLIFTLWIIFSFPPLSGGILVFALGYLLDLFSGNSFGLYTFSRILLFCVLYRFKDHFYLEGFVSQFFLVFISAFLEGLLLTVFLVILNPYPLRAFYGTWAAVLLPQAVFTGLISPLFFSLFEKGSAYILQDKISWSDRGQTG